MSFLSYQRIEADNTVKDVDDLSVPAGATQCQLQSDTNDVRYTMDGTDPTVSSGMLLLTTELAQEFLIEDLKNIKFIRDGGSNGYLNVQYFAGRDV